MLDRHKLYQGVVGLAIGDALGVPAEFVRRKIIENCPVEDMRSGGVWGQPAGTWSDDTSMTLATIDALNKHDWEVTDKCLIDIMDNFKEWYIDGEYAACRNRFDIGNTCRAAIQNWITYRKRNDDFKCCGVGGEAYGNGALMRILPCMFLEQPKDIRVISNLTHDSELCADASLFYVILLRELLKGKSKEDAYKAVVNYNLVVGEARVDKLDKLNINEIKSSGYVIDTLEACIWSFLTTNSYRECVLKAVNLGDDTDTVGALAGGLAGVYYGIGGDKGIPKEWVQKLRDESTLRRICFNN